MMKNVFKKYSHQFPKCFEVARELVASTNVDLNMFELESITQFPSLSLYTSLMLIPSYSTLPFVKYCNSQWNNDHPEDLLGKFSQNTSHSAENRPNVGPPGDDISLNSLQKNPVTSGQGRSQHTKSSRVCSIKYPHDIPISKRQTLLLKSPCF